MTLTSTQANGRMIAAARMLAGLDQFDLAQAAGVAPSTISNVERGAIEARPATLRSIRKALRSKGITLTKDSLNGLVSVATTYDPDE